MTAVVIDPALVSELESCRRYSVVTAVGQTDHTFFVEWKYPKEHSVQIDQIDYKAVPSGRFVVRQVEHLAGLVAIVVVLVAAVE